MIQARKMNKTLLNQAKKSKISIMTIMVANILKDFNLRKTISVLITMMVMAACQVILGVTRKTQHGTNIKQRCRVTI